MTDSADADDSGLFAISVDADDYAEAAAGDVPSVPRTFQSEADFQAQKASYTAKIDNGNIIADLIKAVPELDVRTEHHPESKVTLGKKDVQLLGYAVGEMYYDREYARIIELCERIKEVCNVDGKLEESLSRWMGRCRERMEKRET